MASAQRWVVAVKHGVDVNLTRADPTSGAIDLDHAPRKTSDFDRNAVEEAVRLREKHGGTVRAISVGPASAKEALRDAMALGADEAILLVPPEGAGADSRLTATALAAFLGTPEGTFDVALFGEGSTDHFSGSVGPRVAAVLGRPSVCHVRKLAVDGRRLTAFRDLETGVEEIETDLPAVVTVGQEINTPRLPTFMSTLKASKSAIREVPVASLPMPAIQGWRPVLLSSVRIPTVPRKLTRVPGSDPASIAAALVGLLHGEGVDPV